MARGNRYGEKQGVCFWVWEFSAKRTETLTVYIKSDKYLFGLQVTQEKKPLCIVSKKQQWGLNYEWTKIHLPSSKSKGFDKKNACPKKWHVHLITMKIVRSWMERDGQQHQGPDRRALVFWELAPLCVGERITTFSLTYVKLLNTRREGKV